MKNPWLYLSSKVPFVIPEDKPLLDLFNSRYYGSDKEIMLDQLPSPYVGDPKAPIVLLNLNPGYNKKEDDNELFLKIVRANLIHKFFDYSFCPLNPKLKGTSSGYEWWKRVLAPLMRASGLNEFNISKKLFCVEYFPYHSIKYGYNGKTLPSQKYSQQLVESALNRGAIIIIMRGKKVWYDAIPQLAKYQKRVFILHSPQNVIISEKNLGKEAFDLVVNALCTVRR